MFAAVLLRTVCHALEFFEVHDINTFTGLLPANSLLFFCSLVRVGVHGDTFFVVLLRHRTGDIMVIFGETIDILCRRLRVILV